MPADNQPRGPAGLPIGGGVRPIDPPTSDPIVTLPGGGPAGPTIGLPALPPAGGEALPPAGGNALPPAGALAQPPAGASGAGSAPGGYPHPADIVRFDLARVDALVPVRPGAVERSSGVLTDGGSVDYSGVVPGGAGFLLEYGCLTDGHGDGVLRVEVVTPDGSAHRRQLDCDTAAPAGAIEFATASTGYAMVRLVADTTRFVGVIAQLTPS